MKRINDTKSNKEPRLNNTEVNEIKKRIRGWNSTKGTTFKEEKGGREMEERSIQGLIGLEEQEKRMEKL